MSSLAGSGSEHAVAAPLHLRHAVGVHKKAASGGEREQGKVVEGRRRRRRNNRVSAKNCAARPSDLPWRRWGCSLAAPFLAGSANAIAEQSGISATFIGTSLVGISTSLPELVTAIAAVRLGAFDLAVGNLFGSNAFNMAAFFFVDVAYRGGSIFNAISDTHAMTALWSILLMCIGLMGIIYRVEEQY